MQKQNGTLEVLDLSGNHRLCSQQSSLVPFKEAIITNRCLKTLLLDATGFQSDGAITFAEALPESKTLERLSLLKNDSALNPLRANVLNLGHLVLSQGQVALKNVTMVIQEKLAAASNGSSNGSNGTREAGPVVTSPKESAPPLPSDTAYAALMAFVVAMRLNTSIHQLDIIKDLPALSTSSTTTSSTTAVKEEADGSLKRVSTLVKELRALCERNAQQSQQQKDRLGGGGGEAAFMSQLDPLVESAKQSMLVLGEMMSLGVQGDVVHENGDRWNAQERESMRALRRECAEAERFLDRAIVREEVTQREDLLGMLFWWWQLWCWCWWW